MNVMPDETLRCPSPIAVDTLIESDQWLTISDLSLLIEKVLSAIYENRAFQAFEIEILDGSELSLVFTDDAGIKAINRDHRHQDKPTNVLSFPQHPADADVFGPVLGDIIFAYETIEREAALDKKSFSHHLMHLTVHGFLHLLGFDHEDDGEAEEMEALEIEILSDLDILDPYQIALCDDE